MSRAQVSDTRRVRVDVTAAGVWVTPEVLMGSRWCIGEPECLASIHDVEDFVAVGPVRRLVQQAWAAVRVARRKDVRVSAWGFA